MKNKNILQENEINEATLYGLEVNEVNRTFNDSIFRKYFNDEERLKSLYCALTDEPEEGVIEIEIKTLENVIFGSWKNDLAFNVNKVFIILAEHQSTINKNMPVRMWCYAAIIMVQTLDSTQIHGSALKKIPMPKFYVLYNGKSVWMEKGEGFLYLSEAFDIKEQDECWLELKTKVIDINYERNHPILEKCSCLKEYSYFIYSVRQRQKSGMSIDVAVTKAIDHCIAKGVMKEFLIKYGKEVKNMLTDELTWEQYLEIYGNDRAEEIAEEKVKAMAEKVTEEVTERVTEEVTEKVTEEVTNTVTHGLNLLHAIKLKTLGVGYDIIHSTTGLSFEAIEAL